MSELKAETVQKAAGGLFMDSKEMLKTKLPPGHIFMNVAKLGSKPKWRIVPKPATWGSGGQSA